VRQIARDLVAGASVAGVAAGFHAALVEVTADACIRFAGASGLGTIVLSGGVFQNRLLLEALARRLKRAGLQVLTPVLLPPNDGGISFGQAAIAAARDGAGS
jgi:hydrogenase maturation protein HypF